MAKHQFLTDGWWEEFRQIREEYKDRVKPPAVSMKMNQVVTDVPFGDGEFMGHIDTSEGDTAMGVGHLDEADLTVTTDYDTAKALIVDENQQAAMQAFMAGKVKVQGDMTKMMAMQAQPQDEVAKEMGDRVREMTE